MQAEILKIMGFWIQLGVSGFRMDAVPFVISTKGPGVKKPLRAIRHAALSCANSCNGAKATPSFSRKRMCLPETDMEYFGEDGDRMHMMFNFQVNQNLFYALAAADARPLVKALKATEAAAGDGAVGYVSAQSRRARSRAPDQRAAPESVRCVRTREATCSSTIAASGAGSRPCSAAIGGASSSPTA